MKHREATRTLATVLLGAAWISTAATAQAQAADQPEAAAPAPRADETEPPVMPPAPRRDCRNTSSTFSRFWELDAATDCGPFIIRGYRPISLSWVHGDRVNTAPQSDNDTRDAANSQPYKQSEMRIQLSVRSKLATGLLFREPDGKRDSLWFGYTQQSYWQLFNSELSRPFRTTDHEPEVIYIAPTPAELPWGWQWRYTGLSLNHQSNGQTLPLSRSWNRVILMTGAEKDDRYVLNLRLWQRISDADGDGDGGNSPADLTAQDDNPGIEETYGRAELLVGGLFGRNERLNLMLRHNLRPNSARNGVTAWRVEWLSPLDSASPGLRLHLQVFSGYGDALTDYNYRRTLFSIGLSLVDF